MFGCLLSVRSPEQQLRSPESHLREKIPGGGAKSLHFKISPDDPSALRMPQHVLVNVNTFYNNKYLPHIFWLCPLAGFIFVLIKDVMFI